MTDQTNAMTVLIAVGISVLFVTWFLPWGQLEADSTISSPGQEGFLWAYPGFSWQFDIDVDMSFWWYDFQFNGQRDAGAWFNGESDDAGEVIVANILAMIGLAGLAVYGLLSPRLGERTTPDGEDKVDVRMFAGWLFVVLMPLAMLLWTVGIGNDDGMRHTAAFYFAWIATVTASFGLAWALLTNADSTEESGQHHADSVAKT